MCCKSDLQHIYCEVANKEQLFHDREINLSFFQIGTFYTDADGIAELVFVMVAPSDKTVVLLIEVVVVIVEFAHGYHAFAVVLVNLAVDAV